MECLFKTSYRIDKYYWQRRFYWRWSRSCLIYLPSTRWKNRTRHCVRSVRGERCAWCTRFFFLPPRCFSFFLSLFMCQSWHRTENKVKRWSCCNGHGTWGWFVRDWIDISAELVRLPPTRAARDCVVSRREPTFYAWQTVNRCTYRIVWNYVNHSSNGNKHCVNGNSAYRAR